MRVLDSANLVFNLEQLGFRLPLIEKFTRCIKSPHGLFLVTGPTGSGKTTTLYSALNMLRTPEQNIITIEDPVEYQLGMVNQVQINSAIDLTFAVILRSVLRQDPNIIMLGEIRDVETAEVAVQASLTGHLVLSTLHTNSAIGAIARLGNLKVEPFLVGSAVIGIIAQRLTRRICSSCKQVYQPEPDLLARMGLKPDAAPYWRGAGCRNCFNSGYRGRVGLYEIMEVDPTMRRLLERGASPEELKNQRQKSGETTLFEEGMIAANSGQTTLDEVLRVAGGASSNE
jgi:type II secretory ATPase GspE/PulE/Tfp pilus assembly ATPase PilB-like protein